MKMGEVGAEDVQIMQDGKKEGIYNRLFELAGENLALHEIHYDAGKMVRTTAFPVCLPVW